MNKQISKHIKYIGVNDKNIDLFESQYVVPNGISYNSYIIEDEKIVIMDTVDMTKQAEWLDNLTKVLDGKTPDYLVISHLEEDHSGSIEFLLNKYINIKVIGNAKTISMFNQFYDINIDDRKIVIAEGENFNIGRGSLQFYMAPMVHWPEVMFTYYDLDKALFTADGFGKFGDLNANETWVDEARRYYFNICGKYGMQVQSILKKANQLKIDMICPLHGPILQDNLNYYISLYDKWSKYEPEENAILIPYCSIHGNTEQAVLKLDKILKSKGQKVILKDLARSDISEVISLAYKCSKMIVASVTYNMSVFPMMNLFLTLLKEKNYQNRIVGIVQNGSWAPNSAKVMKEYFSNMKDINVLEPIVTIKSKLNSESLKQMQELVDKIIY